MRIGAKAIQYDMDHVTIGAKAIQYAAIPLHNTTSHGTDLHYNTLNDTALH